MGVLPKHGRYYFITRQAQKRFKITAGMKVQFDDLNYGRPVFIGSNTHKYEYKAGDLTNMFRGYTDELGF